VGALPLALVGVESVGKSSVLFPAGIPCFGRLGKPSFSEEPMLPSDSFSWLYWENWQVFIMGKKWSNRRLAPACLLVFCKGKKESPGVDLPPDNIS